MSSPRSKFSGDGRKSLFKSIFSRSKSQDDGDQASKDAKKEPKKRKKSGSNRGSGIMWDKVESVTGNLADTTNSLIQSTRANSRTMSVDSGYVAQSESSNTCSFNVSSPSMRKHTSASATPSGTGKERKAPPPPRPPPPKLGFPPPPQPPTGDAGITNTTTRTRSGSVPHIKSNNCSSTASSEEEYGIVKESPGFHTPTAPDDGRISTTSTSSSGSLSPTTTSPTGAITSNKPATSATTEQKQNKAKKTKGVSWKKKLTSSISSPLSGGGGGSRRSSASSTQSWTQQQQSSHQHHQQEEEEEEKREEADTGTDDNMGHRKQSYSEKQLLSMESMERVPSVYLDDDEAFCIDGWHDDEDDESMSEGFSSAGSDQEDFEGDSEYEDAVDAPTSTLILDINSPAGGGGGGGGGGEVQKPLRVIDESKTIPKFQRVAMEILTTESTYVKRLSLLESLRKRLEETHTLSNEALNNIFKNLPELLKFHKETVLPNLQKRMDQWEKNPRIGDIMKEFAPFLKIYTPFVKNIENARKSLSSLKKTPKAGVVIDEVQKSQDSSRIPIQDFLTEPMTRLLRYKLLLGEYLRKLPEEHADRKSTEDALDNISEIATYVNESIRAEDNLTKMVQIKESLQGDIELVQPHRTFVKEGRIAMVNRAKDRHLETHIYLFDDLLLVCQPPVMGTKYKVHKQLSMKGLKVERDDDNHFTVTSRKAVIDFYGSTQREAGEWESSFRDAITKYKEKHKPTENEADIELELEEELGYRAPHLVRKDTASSCSQCCLGFTSLRRTKNHCFACGQLFCPRCANRSLPLAYDNWHPRRVCDRCFSSLRDDAVCKSVESLDRDDWVYGDLLPREEHESFL